MGVEAIQALLVVATSASLSRGDKMVPVGGVMSFAGISELIDQSLVIRVELEALSLVMAVSVLYGDYSFHRLPGQYLLSLVHGRKRRKKNL